MNSGFVWWYLCDHINHSWDMFRTVFICFWDNCKMQVCFTSLMLYHRINESDFLLSLFVCLTPSFESDSVRCILSSSHNERLIDAKPSPKLTFATFANDGWREKCTSLETVVSIIIILLHNMTKHAVQYFPLLYKKSYPIVWLLISWTFLTNNAQHSVPHISVYDEMSHVSPLVYSFFVLAASCENIPHACWHKVLEKERQLQASYINIHALKLSQ